MKTKLIPGSYIKVKEPFGFKEAVFIKKTKGVVSFRYKAARPSHEEEIWILDACQKERILFLRPPDKQSEEVLTFSGIHGKKR